MKPPVLPSGHHLQIPAQAQVKTLPVSVLPPVIIPYKILDTAAASNTTSRTSENINAPIFVSPANTMKMSASESLETKSVGEVSSSLIRVTPQKFINSSAKVSTSGSMENKRIPIKWIVYENPESSTSYIVPAKSSKKVASKLLKTLTNMKNTKNSSTSILPVCSSSSHAKIPSASSHDNLHISSITQHEAVSSGRTASIGVNVAQKYVTKENTHDNSHKDLSSKAATDPTSPPVAHHAVKDEKQQTKMTSGMAIGMKHIQEEKKHLQLRNKIGLSKEERVYLSSVPSKNSEASIFSNSVQMNDIDNLMSTSMKCESEKVETIFGEQEGKLNIKRKPKAIPILENPKRKNVKTMQNSHFECNSSYSVMENLNNSCTQNLPEQEHSTSFLQCPHKVSNPWVTNNSEENRVLNSISNCHENETALDESFSKKDIFPFSPPDLEETIKDEKITRLKRLLREREAALEAIRKKMHQC